LIHLDSRLDAREHVHLFERVLERERVHDRRQHTHVIGGNTIEALCAGGKTAKDVAATDHDTDLNAEFMDILDFGGNAANNLGIDTETGLAHQDFAAQLEQNAFVFGFGQWKTLIPQQGLYFTAEICAAFFETFACFETCKPADANVLADFADQ